MTAFRSVILSCAAGLAAVLVTTRASADLTKAQCIAADTQGQDLRRETKLSAAREQFRACASASCPAIVRDDCTSRLDELERVQPTIIFDAKDAAGRDVSAVRVTMDGKPLTDRLTGAPLQVDPGEHDFVFQAEGASPVDQKFVIKEGERDRRERVVVAQGVASTSAPPVPAPLSTPSRNHLGGTRVLGITAAAIGVAGLGVGTAFGLLAISASNDQKHVCATTPTCTDHPKAVSDHNTAATDATIADVGFIAGGVLLVTGAVLFFVGRPHTESALVVLPTAGRDGAGLALRGGF